MNEYLRADLLAMAAEDLRVRSELAADGSLFDGYHPRMREVHDRNAIRLNEIIRESGWPGRELVAEDGAEAAWLIAQHAIAQPWFQRRWLVLLQEAATRGDVPLWQPAYLLDRIRVFEGRPQVYGTQFESGENGQPRPNAIEQPERVNERRKQAGLDTIEEQTLRIRKEAATEPRPGDRAEFERRYQEWLREVGWRK